ncbi:MAG TPA: VOC family protein [Pseudonocardiaceae bacterium]|jgi:uncharacterized glyoxalase superfamily protein PhnB|nr:VOC family protein [Pseudonocardiaceae bacterium]
MARMDYIGIVVEDMARSLRFYRAAGLDIPAEADNEQHVDLTLPSGMRVAWDTVSVIRSFDPDWQPQEGNRLAIGFQCDTPAEVDKLYDDLTAAGHTGHRKPWDAFWGQRYASVYDPDGVSVDLFAARGA